MALDVFTARLGATQGRITPTGHTTSLVGGDLVDATVAELTSGAAETYALTEGNEFLIVVDQGEEQSILFDSDDFADITNATAAEVAVVLNRDVPRAQLPAGAAEPYNFTDGDVLTIRSDDGPDQTVTFETVDFADIGSATAAEVVTLINGDTTGLAAKVVDSRPVLTSDTQGTDSALEVTGGDANDELEFSTVKVSGSEAVTASDASGSVKLVADTLGDDGCIQINDPESDNANQIFNFDTDLTCGVTGGFSFVLGDDLEDRLADLEGGDEVSISQSGEFNDGDVARIFGFVRMPESIPSGYGWEMVFSVAGFDEVLDIVLVTEFWLEDFGLNVSQLAGAQTLAITLRLTGPATEDEFELPGVYLDIVPIAQGAADVLLLNRFPASDQVDVPMTLTDWALLIVSTTGTAIDTSETQVYIEGTLAYDGTAGGWQVGFSGVVTAATGPSSHDARFVIDISLQTYTSEQVIDVRVVSETTGGGSTIDETYSFTMEDTTQPQVVGAQARAKKTVRISFNEAMQQVDPTASGDALNPANYTFTRLSIPAVALAASSVASVSDTAVDITTDVEHTQNASYRVNVANVTDDSGNVIDPAVSSAIFLGFIPLIPAGRDFDLTKMMPNINRREDTTGDLELFLRVLQDPVNLFLCAIDEFTEIFDPDRAAGGFLDAILAGLGNPFAFDLTEIDKRRLISILVGVYQQKGTAVGIINAVRFFLGIEVQISPVNVFEGGWILGESELGVDTLLHAGERFLLYSFEIISPVVLTTEQADRMLKIADYMKPAHEHIVRIVQPGDDIEISFWILGESELGEDTILSEITSP